MEWFVLLSIGLCLLLFPGFFSKIGWFNFDNLNGNEATWEKDYKKHTITRKALYVYRMIGILLVVIGVIKIFFMYFKL